MSRVRWGLILALVMALWLVSLPVFADEAGTALMGQQVTLASGDVQQGDLVLLGGGIEMLPGSRVEGDLAVIGGSARLAGEVTGIVAVFGGTLSLEKGAVVHGDVVVAGAMRYRHPEAVVLGSVFEGLDSAAGLERLPDGWLRDAAPSFDLGAGSRQPASRQGNGVGALGGIILMMALATVAISVAPDYVTHTRQVMLSSAPLSVGVGLLTLVASAVLIPLLIAICIGIPVAVVVGLALLVALALAWVAVGQIVGEKLFAWLKVTASPLVQAVVGVLVIGLLASIPCLGPVAVLLALSWGLGAVVLTRFGTRVDPLWSLTPTVDGTVRSSTPVVLAPEKGAADEDASAFAPSSGAPEVVRAEPTQPGTRPLDERLLDEIADDAEDELKNL